MGTITLHLESDYGAFTAWLADYLATHQDRMVGEHAMVYYEPWPHVEKHTSASWTVSVRTRAFAVNHLDEPEPEIMFPTNHDAITFDVLRLGAGRLQIKLSYDKTAQAFMCQVIVAMARTWPEIISEMYREGLLTAEMATQLERGTDPMKAANAELRTTSQQPKARVGRPRDPDADWAWEQVNELGLEPREVYKEWCARVRNRGLADPQDSFRKAIRKQRGKKPEETE